VGCLRTHTSFDVLEKQSHTAIRHHTSKRKNQAVSRRKVEPWGLVEDCEKERKKRKERHSPAQNVITVSSITTIPGRRAKFIAREQEKIKKGMRR
jgi:hypothetical protein